MIPAIAALLTWTLPPGGAEPDGFRVYVCDPDDTGVFRVHREVVEARRLDVPQGTYRVTALYNGRPVTDSEGVESPSTVESSFSEPIDAVVIPDPPEPRPDPDPDPMRVRVTIWSSPDLRKDGARVEAVIYHVPTEPARFWWADIKQE